MELSIKMELTALLKDFTEKSLSEATTNLLSTLGIQCSIGRENPIDFINLYKRNAECEKLPNYIDKIFSRIANAYYIGDVTDNSLHGKVEEIEYEIAGKDEKYHGMFVFAIEIKPGEQLTRNEAALLVRGFNRIVYQQPATVLMQEGNMLSIGTCERTEYKQDWRPGEKLGKVSILRHVDCNKPHRGHLDILEELKIEGRKSFDELYKQWQKVFSTKTVTDKFYKEIRNWYFWAQKSEHQVQFPNDPTDQTSQTNAKFNGDNLIRLITRLIFTWFMKEKGLVNRDLFEPEFLKKALRDFYPQAIFSGKSLDKSCTFYRAILQNLFFATFNQEIGERCFVESSKYLDVKRHAIKNYYRNANLFQEKDEKVILSYFNASPFVNGGLFECLDDVQQDGKNYSWDGFSNHFRDKNGNLKSALVPDYLFFGEETRTDLSEFLVKGGANQSVRGIINILNDYIFTIEENTPQEVAVALDPELLGKVFENLLACYNPETKEVARNATGSFYTPREIVDYMVSESLKAFIVGKCPEVNVQELEMLLAGSDELTDMPTVQANKSKILQALFKAKILDPACGSGAFPMGIMLAMVNILRILDPDNKEWYEIVLRESLDEAEKVAGTSDKKEREELKRQIEYDFKSRVDHSDYARKLYVIERCIFGSDIQPIAVQISRLRFFITLLCEQTRTKEQNKNYGITPLPNLENNFVAANSLLSLDLDGMREILEDKEILSKVEELRSIRHQLFQPKTSDRKKALVKKDESLRTEIAQTADRLYDEALKRKIELVQKELTKVKREIASLTDDDRKDQIKVMEERDLFGNMETKTKVTPGKEKILLEQKKRFEKTIEELKNDSQKKVILDNLKRLVKWNPFAFNHAEEFLDPEWMFGAKDGFDIVIGNPPYISAPDQLKSDVLLKQRKLLAKSKRFKTLVKKWDLYIPFMEISIRQFLKDDGVFTMIVPYPLTNQTYGAKVRQMLVQDYDLFLLVDLKNIDVFETATVKNCIPFVRKSSSTGKLWIATADEKKYISRSFEKGTEKLMPDGKACVWYTSQEMQNINKHAEMHVLGDFCYVSKGMVLNADEREERGTFRKEDLISLIKDDTHPREYIEAKDVDRYVIKRVRYLEYGTMRSPTKLSRPTFPELYNAEKLVFNCLGCINATLDASTHFLHNHSLYCAVLWNSLTSVQNNSIASSVKKFSKLKRSEMEKLSRQIDLRYLLGIMNSKYGDMLLISLRGGDYHIYPEHIRNIPIPLVSAENQIPIITLVDHILAAKKANPQADTSAWEGEIDQLVYQLYGLTEEEIAIVKRATANAPQPAQENENDD